MDQLRRIAKYPIWDQGETKNIYGFPLLIGKSLPRASHRLAKGIPENQLYHVGPFFAVESPESHIGPFKWAVDFLVPDETRVLATEKGQIIEAIDGFNEWGPTEEFRKKLNYITIGHSNEEHSQCCHLAQNSFRKTGLKVGDYVKKGQVIAKVGKTGWTDRDHLHFIVFKLGRLPRSPYGFYSLRIRFDTH